MKRFEIYRAYIPQFSQTETTVINLQNNFVDNDESIICAPITSKSIEGDNHIKAVMQNGNTIYIIAEHMINIKKDKIFGKIGELTEECREEVENSILEVMGFNNCNVCD